MGLNPGTAGQPLHLLSRCLQRGNELTGDLYCQSGGLPARPGRPVRTPYDGGSGEGAVGGAAEGGQVSLA